MDTVLLAAAEPTWFDSLMAGLVPIILTTITALITWGMRKLKIEGEAKEVIVAMTQRVVDKFEDWHGVVTDPASDGGIRITKAEISLLRQRAYDLAISEAKGPVAAKLKDWGEARVKGLIGGLLKKWDVAGSSKPAETE